MNRKDKLIVTILGLIFILIGFKYLIFDTDLVLSIPWFAILTYFLIGLGGYLVGRFGFK
jgi:hypothetical protein